MNNFGVAQIQRGWAEFIRANPGLKDCVLRTKQQPSGVIDFEVSIGGIKHTHVFDPSYEERHADLTSFLVGLTDVSKQRGGGEPTPRQPDVFAVPGRRKMILEVAS